MQRLQQDNKNTTKSNGNKLDEKNWTTKREKGKKEEKDGKWKEKWTDALVEEMLMHR